MAYRTRVYDTAKQKADIWGRWQHGESINSIGRVFDRKSSSIFSPLATTAGMRSLPRKQPRLAFSGHEEISRGLPVSYLYNPAAQPGRSQPTVSRDIRLNGGYEGLSC